MAEQSPGRTPSTDPGAPSLRLAVSRAGERIQQIIDTAERVAAEIRDEAEQEAADHLDRRRHEADRILQERERELAELTETVVARAAVVQRELDGLVDTLQQAIGRIAALGISDAAPAHVSSRAARPSTTESDPRDSVSDEALLRLTQMAVAGSDRAELERTLREEFGVAHTEPVLDEVLGPPLDDPGPRLGRFMGPARFHPPERTG